MLLGSSITDKFKLAIKETEDSLIIMETPLLLECGKQSSCLLIDTIELASSDDRTNIGIMSQIKEYIANFRWLKKHFFEENLRHKKHSQMKPRKYIPTLL